MLPLVVDQLEEHTSNKDVELVELKKKQRRNKKGKYGNLKVKLPHCINCALQL